MVASELLAAGASDLAGRLAESVRHRPDVAPVLQWIEERRHATPFRVERVPLSELRGWRVAEGGNLVHETGRFFSVEGLRVRTDHGADPEWWQPVLNQTDVAVLGILATEIEGVLHFLMQAKMEPGNVNAVQLSPTVQATASNYLRVHRGAAARYVEYFVEPGRGRTLVDVLQSEQGSWFHRKRNRNIVLEVPGPVEPHEDFVWLSLGQLHDLLDTPHTLNMDARTVLSCLPPPRPAAAADPWAAGAVPSVRGAVHPLGGVRSWLTTHKAAHLMAADLAPMDAVGGWSRTDAGIEHDAGRYFTVIGARVHAPSREVAQWCQPLLEPRGTGLAAFVLRRFAGVAHVLARADVRPGYRDTAEIGPTVQCQPDNYRHLPSQLRPPMLDLVLSGALPVHVDVEQSEEGGRFASAVTRHLVVEARSDVELPLDDRFCWTTPAQLAALVGTSYQLDIEARSLLLHLHAMAGPW